MDQPTEPLPPLPTWTRHEDGSVTIHLPTNMVANLADDLNRWDALHERQYSLPAKWRRSPTWREIRRESIVYGNCLETIKVLLNRREVNSLMKQYQEDTDG